MIIVQCESLTSFHVFLDISDGVSLLSYTDQRGLCDSLGMFRRFFHTLDSRLCLEDIDDRWMHFSDYLAAVGQICLVPGQCAPDYMDWFYIISHPFMGPAQPGDPVRHPPVMQDDTYVEPDMPQ